MDSISAFLHISAETKIYLSSKIWIRPKATFKTYYMHHTFSKKMDSIISTLEHRMEPQQKSIFIFSCVLFFSVHFLQLFLFIVCFLIHQKEEGVKEAILASLVSCVKLFNSFHHDYARRRNRAKLWLCSVSIITIFPSFTVRN